MRYIDKCWTLFSLFPEIAIRRFLDNDWLKHIENLLWEVIIPPERLMPIFEEMLICMEQKYKTIVTFAGKKVYFTGREKIIRFWYVSGVA